MGLKDDFNITNAQLAAQQSLGFFMATAMTMARQPEIKAAMESTPPAVLKGRDFVQIVADDAMDLFATVMAETIRNSDAKFEDIPHGFYLGLMRSRFGGKVSEKESVNRLREHVKFKLDKPPSVPGQPRAPVFLRLLSTRLSPQALANLTNSWSSVTSGFATLMMTGPSLAATMATKEIINASATEMQEIVNTRMKMIQEAGNGTGAGGNANTGSKKLDSAVEKMLKKDLPPEVREKIEEEMDKLARDPQGPEGNKVREYLKWAASLPWNEFSALEKNINKAEARLESDHYGLEKVKKAIIEHIAVENHTKGSGGRILCLSGPPGVGKTSVAASIAKATGREYARMSLGGVRDEADIRGHIRTYVGARPGRLIETMKKAKASNPLIVLDEIDKMSNGGVNGDPTAAMLEVLDPAQNNTFHDHFMEVDYDLSKVMFIATANDLGNIPGPLRDRMDIIQIPGYTREEKLEIAKRHLVTKKMAANGLTDQDVKIDDSALKRLISEYTREAGVRSLERKIDSLCRKVVLGQERGEMKGLTTVTAANLENFAGNPLLSKMNAAARGDRVGVVNGLAWSAVGGSILQIEAKKDSGTNFSLEITGNLQTVMKESGAVARRVAFGLARRAGIKVDDLRKMEVHVHALDGAVPKDGPSAGAAMATAITSAVTGIPIRCNVAMTGEVSLNGDVMPIGGLPEKLDGALQDGADTVLIPVDNVRDLDKVPDSIKDKLTIIAVSRIEEVLEHALAKPLALAPESSLDATPAVEDAPVNSGRRATDHQANDNNPDVDTAQKKQQAAPLPQIPAKKFTM